MNERASSLDKGMSVLNMGLYPGFLLTGKIVSISFGLMFIRWVRKWSGEVSFDVVAGG